MRVRSLSRHVAIAALVLSLWGVAGCPSGLPAGPVFSPEGTTTTIIIVRHTERDASTDLVPDPPLNAEGEARAIALADELEDDGVTAIFYPDFVRNQQTAAPLLERVDATVRTFTQAESSLTKSMAERFLTEVVRDHAGGVVLWIGNTGPVIEGVQEGNLQETYYRLGGTGDPPIRYQDMYRAVLTDSAPPQITEGEYGGPSSLD